MAFTFRQVVAASMVVLAACFLPPIRGAEAKAMYGKAALVVRDGSDLAPLSGAKVTLENADPAERDSEKAAAEDNTATTDEQGYAAARVYVGCSQTRWAPFMGAHRTKRMDIRSVYVTVGKTGYQTFRGTCNVFYSAFRKGKGTYVFLDEVHLAPEGYSQNGQSVPQGVVPTVSVEPGWGDEHTPFLVKAQFVVPPVLAHEYDEALIEPVAVADVSLAPVTLKDDGKAPDQVRGDGVCTGTVKLKRIAKATIVDQLEVQIEPRSPQHSFVTATARTISTSDGSPVFGGKERNRSEAVKKVPVRWVLAPQVDEAKRLYEQQFGNP